MPGVAWQREGAGREVRKKDWLSSIWTTASPLKSLACETRDFPQRPTAFGSISQRREGILWILEHGMKLWLLLNTATYSQKYLFQIHHSWGPLPLTDWQYSLCIPWSNPCSWLHSITPSSLESIGAAVWFGGWGVAECHEARVQGQMPSCAWAHTDSHKTLGKHMCPCSFSFLFLRGADSFPVCALSPAILPQSPFVSGGRSKRSDLRVELASVGVFMELFCLHLYSMKDPMILSYIGMGRFCLFQGGRAPAACVCFGIALQFWPGVSPVCEVELYLSHFLIKLAVSLKKQPSSWFLLPVSSSQMFICPLPRASPFSITS